MQAELIQPCKAIKCSETIENAEKSKKFNKKDKMQQKKVAKSKNFKGNAKKESNTASFFCSQHGKNYSHNTSDCCMLKSKQNAYKPKNGNKTFSDKGLMKEINFLSCTTPKDQILDKYLAVISKEKAKLQARKAKREQAQLSCDSESDNSLDYIVPNKKTK